MSSAAQARLLPRLDVIRHLALYTTFHSSRGNRVAHGVCVPIVLVSGLFLMAYVRLPSAHALSPLLHLGTLLTVVMCVALATIDAIGSLCLLAFLLPFSAAAGAAAAGGPALLVIPAAIAVHLAAWYGTVAVGHQKLEPWLATAEGREDSNLYFRRGYYLGRDIGAPVNGLDAFIQFCIAPLSVAQDALLCAGLRRSLQSAIDDERERVTARIERGEAPLLGSRAAYCPTARRPFDILEACVQHRFSSCSERSTPPGAVRGRSRRRAVRRARRARALRQAPPGRRAQGARAAAAAAAREAAARRA